MGSSVAVDRPAGPPRVNPGAMTAPRPWPLLSAVPSSTSWSDGPMGALGFVQLVVDVLFLFLLMVLMVGRVWKRGAAATEEHASYREMIASLTALIREMKETAAELE